MRRIHLRRLPRSRANSTLGGHIMTLSDDRIKELTEAGHPDVAQMAREIQELRRVSNMQSRFVAVLVARVLALEPR